MSFIKREIADCNMDSKPNVDDINQSEFFQQSIPTSSITAFLAKLWALVNDESSDDLIAWDPSGGSFHVYDQARFSREILPRYFKHNNFASFIRQLNMYGFRKITNIEHGSLKSEKDDIEFAHPNFIRGQESLLELIKRRPSEHQTKSNTQGGPNSSSALVATNYLDSKSGNPMEFSRLLVDVRNLQSKQTSLSDKLSYLQTENQALWGEIGSLRNKHNKQQQIVSKLMEFLLAFITGNSVHTHNQSVEQPSENENLKDNSLHPEQTHVDKQQINPQFHLKKQDLSNTLKRKHAALMHRDEPNKRTTAQQEEQYSRPNKLRRQQSVTINELTDYDPSVWLHTANASPLVDLVPSPPPSVAAPQMAPLSDDIYQHQWVSSSDELLHPTISDQVNLSQQNQTLQGVNNINNEGNTFVPDFYLQTDDTTGTNVNSGQPNKVNLSEMKTGPQQQVLYPTILKEEQIEFPNKFQENSVQEIKPSTTLFPENHHNKIHPPLLQSSFSVDDITGDVDQIQSSLDNIRELMFYNLPEGIQIDDLFEDNNAFLEPFLQSTGNENLNDSLLLQNIQQPIENTSEQNGTIQNSQSIPNVNNQLFEQLMTEKTLVQEQRNTINQLEREKLDLEDKIQLLEQKNNNK